MCPSLANLKKRETKELLDLAIKGIKAQILEIEEKSNSIEFEKNLVEDLKKLCN